MSNDLEYVGQVFENLVIRDLLIYSEACGARMSYYRDNNGLEVDVIIEGDDAAWIAIEIKLGQRNLDACADRSADYLALYRITMSVAD